MKKINMLLTATLIITGFVSCKNSENDAAKQDVANLNMYVDSVEKATPIYTVGNWSSLDEGYQMRATQAEKNMAKLEAADKEKLEASKTRYATLKANYEAKLKEQEAASNMKLKETEGKLQNEINQNKTATVTGPDYRQVLRNRLFGEGKIGADMKFEFVTAQNIYGVYKNFVNTVADNKNDYTREDWDEIKVLYEALDTRKNAVEKDLAGSDNRQIALLKIRFATIKATHRGGTKAAENEAAKK
jgi:uncharacterized protein (UPF0210 family)